MSGRLSQNISRLCASKKFPWIIISVGITLRLIRYLHNPSLYFDESGIAVDLSQRSLSDLMHPSPYFASTYPLGFLVVIKLAVMAFGHSEYVFRFFPLICGIAAILLFFKVAKYYLKPEAVLIALGLFAFLDPLIYFSSELKPYMCDVAVALLLYSVTIYIQSRKLTILRTVFFGGVGAIVLWFSNPSIFVLTGIGATFTISCLMKKKWTELKMLSLVFSLWASSFITVYIFYIRELMQNFSHLTNNDIYWMKQKAFMPLPPMSLSDIQWFIELPTRVFNFPTGLMLTGIASFTFLVGCVSIYLEKKERFFIFISPVVIALMASVFKMYAFANEPIFFIVPMILIFIAEGTEFIKDKTSHKSSVIGIILLCLLFVYPLSWTAYHAIKPASREEIKPVLNHIKDNWREGDQLYVYYMAIRAFDYYSKYHPGNFHFDEDEYVLGRAQRDWYATYRKQDFTGFWDKDRPFSQPYTSVLKEYIDDINKLRGHKRVWFLFSSKVMKGGIHEENFFHYYLESIGKQLDFYGLPGLSAVYLYDLSGQTSGG